MHGGQKKLIRRWDISKGETVFTTLMCCRFYLGARLSIPKLERHKQQQNRGLIQPIPVFFFGCFFFNSLHVRPWLMAMCAETLLIKAVDLTSMVGVSGPLHHSLEWNLGVAFLDWWEFPRLRGGTMRSALAQSEKRSRAWCRGTKGSRYIFTTRSGVTDSGNIPQPRSGSSCQLAHCERKGN